MKAPANAPLGKGWILPAILAATIAFQGSVWNVEAQIVTLEDNNSRALVDVGSSAGMFEWSILMPNGQWQNQLNQQWFWYRIGNNPEQSVDTIGNAAWTTPNARTLVSTYANNQVSVQIDYLLSGGTTASGVSDIGETITIRNAGATALSFSFFQYSDFNLEGVVGSQQVTLGKNLRGLWNEAYQETIPSGFGLTETVTTPGANHGEAALFNSTLLKLTDGVADNLNDVGSSAVGNATWALQWDFYIPVGGSAIISKDKYIRVPAVPEPSVLALVFCGLFGWAIQRRRSV